MRKSRLIEAQIIGVLKAQEARMATAEMRRPHWLSPATFYKLQARYGGIDDRRCLCGAGRPSNQPLRTFINLAFST